MATYYVDWEVVCSTTRLRRFRCRNLPRLMFTMSTQFPGSVLYYVDGQPVPDIECALRLAAEPPALSALEIHILGELGSGADAGMLPRSITQILVEKGCLDDALMLTPLGRSLGISP